MIRSIFSLMLLLVTSAVFSQSMFKGKVVDKQGNLLPGVTIKDKHAGKSYITNALGEFNILTQFQELYVVISHQTYQTVDTLLKEKPSAHLMMLVHRSHALDLVEINTGYQKIPQDRMTGSFVQLDEKLLNRRNTLSVLDKIEGLAPGLQFDNRSGVSKINIRGLTSFSSGNQPLIIVDNFPYEGDLSNIDPAEVASVSILKDAAATSIWGAKAGNGVIVINLKRAAKMAKVAVAVRYNSFIGSKPNLFYQPGMSSTEFIEVERDLYDQGFYTNALANRNNKTTIFSPVVLLSEQLRKGEIALEELEIRIGNYKSKDYRQEMSDKFYRLALDNQVNATISSGSQFFASRLSVGYQDNKASEITSDAGRINIRWIGEINPTSRLTLIPSLTLTLSQSNRPGSFPNYPLSPEGGRTRLYPYASLFDDTGKPLSIPFQYNPMYLESQNNKGLMDWGYRPYEEINATRSISDASHIMVGNELKYSVTKGLKINLLYNYEKQLGRNEVNYNQESFYTRNQVNRYTVIKEGQLIYNLPKGDIVRYNTANMEAHKGRFQLNYDTVFNKHEIHLLAGMELSNKSTVSVSNGIYGFQKEKQTSQLVDYVTAFPIYDALSGNAKIPSFQTNSKYINRFVSTYFNGSYTYSNRYTASFSARKDASNIFGVNANNRWNPLWSTGLSWQVGKEHFLKHIKMIDHLKLATTYGYSGNSGGVASLYPIMEYMAKSITWTSDLNRARVTSLPNADLKWEKIRQTNFAVNFSLWNGKLSGTVETYFKKSTDLLSPDLIDPTHGFVSLTKNIGVIKTKGVDLQFGSRLKWRDFSWSGDFLLTWNKNTVTTYYGVVNASSSYVSNTGRSVSPIVGYSLYPVFAYSFSGLDPENGDPRGLLNGEVSKDYRNLTRVPLDQLIHYGTALPPVYGSFRNEFGYNKWRLSFNLLFKSGHYFQKETIQYASLFNNWVTHSDYSMRWQKAGDEAFTSVPSMIYPANSVRDQFYANSEPNILKGDLIRLNDLQLMYSFHVADKYKIEAYANGQNLGLIWRSAKTDLDPDYSFVPKNRIYSIGVNINF